MKTFSAIIVLSLIVGFGTLAHAQGGLLVPATPNLVPPDVINGGCPSGSTEQSDGTCISYTCPAGYTLSGTACSPSGSTNAGGQQNSVTNSGGQQTVNPTNTTNTTGGTTLLNPLSAGTNLQTFLQDILQFVVQIGTVVVILMLVYVGFLFATAQGDPSKISAARQALLWTVIGALILLGAQVIATGIQATATALSAGT